LVAKLADVRRLVVLQVAAIDREIPAISMPDGQQYGYQWYVSTVAMDDGAGSVLREKTINAVGNGGQRLFLLPRLELVVAVTAGNYDDPNQGRPPMVVLRDLILPALRAG
jgi:CubicO group peptidase (beta-lactamase class C family)